MAKILITGGSGLVGRCISELLLEQGHEPRWLSRGDRAPKGIRTYRWDVSRNYVDENAFEGVEYLVHLAGTGIIDKRWTSAFKKEIIASRVQSSELLHRTIEKNGFKLRAFSGASAVGYYGSQPSDQWFTEEAPPGNDFLSETCKAWENSYTGFIRSGIRTSVLRIGMVLSPRGGAYTKMAPAFRLGLGAPMASGEQYMPWIHIKDLSWIFVYSLFNEHMHGVYNAVASHPVSNKEFSKALAKSFDRPLFLPKVPAFMLKLALGEKALTVTSGLKVSNQKLKKAGFRFEHDDLESSLNELAAFSKAT